ncbi:hypothetical protein ACTMS0_16130 [Micromonospora sp. H33]
MLPVGAGPQGAGPGRRHLFARFVGCTRPAVSAAARGHLNQLLRRRS